MEGVLTTPPLLTKRKLMEKYDSMKETKRVVELVAATKGISTSDAVNVLLKRMGKEKHRG